MYILGTGPLAEEFLALLCHAGVRVTAFVENLERSKAETRLHDHPVIWVDDLPRGAECLCALSTTHRSKFIDQVRDKARFPGFVHPSSVVLPFGTMGEGCVVSSGALIAGHATLGNHVFVNRGACIGHHTEVGDYSTIQPGANIAGLTRIGSRVYVGMGALVRERLVIGSGSIIAAGAVVTRDVPERCLVAGHPAALKRRGVDPR
jgi:sugar O-acyltransferase (sialic acid O-acetyltransferase NeuD family)